MAIYEFGFGLCTPAQWKAMRDHGWEEESSWFFHIRAPDEASAERWGKHLAEEFVRHLFENDGWPSEIPGWIQSNFAFWTREIDRENENVDSEVQPISVGEEPDYSLLTKSFYSPFY